MNTTADETMQGRKTSRRGTEYKERHWGGEERTSGGGSGTERKRHREKYD